MVAAFSEGAGLVFEGIPVGPFSGREAIGAAYAAQPPDDEIVLLDGDGTYAWAKEPDMPAGQMFLTERDGEEIARLVIRYDRQILRRREAVPGFVRSLESRETSAKRGG